MDEPCSRTSSLEKESLVGGKASAFELSARFCSDAINNSYFKENRELYPPISLVRAQSQVALAMSAKENRSICTKIIAQ